MKASALLLLCFVATAAAASVAGVKPRHAVGGKPAADGEVAAQAYVGCRFGWEYTYYANYKCVPQIRLCRDWASPWRGGSRRRAVAAVNCRPRG
jgi:hypothetical protein